jgi:hypothetical protein
MYGGYLHASFELLLRTLFGELLCSDLDTNIDSDMMGVAAGVGLATDVSSRDNTESSSGSTPKLQSQMSYEVKSV